MQKTLKSALFAAAAMAAVTAATPASAAIYTSNLPEFNYDGPDVGNSAEQIVGSFLFSIGAGETIVSASLSGTFGNSQASNSAGVQLFGDGNFLGECVYQAACWGSSGPHAFNFAVSDFASLADGALIFSIIQTSEFITRLGATTLTIETRPSAVPVPAALPLLATALGALGFVARRRKSA